MQRFKLYYWLEDMGDGSSCFKYETNREVAVEKVDQYVADQGYGDDNVEELEFLYENGIMSVVTHKWNSKKKIHQEVLSKLHEVKE